MATLGVDGAGEATNTVVTNVCPVLMRIGAPLLGPDTPPEPCHHRLDVASRP
jgi:hypothetical protein